MTNTLKMHESQTTNILLWSCPLVLALRASALFMVILKSKKIKPEVYIYGDKLERPSGFQARCDLSIWHGWSNTELDFWVQNTLHAVISQKTLNTHKGSRPAATRQKKRKGIELFLSCFKCYNFSGAISNYILYINIQKKTFMFLFQNCKLLIYIFLSLGHSYDVFPKDAEAFWSFISKSK